MDLDDGWDVVVLDENSPSLLRGLGAISDSAELGREMTLSLLQAGMNAEPGEIVVFSRRGVSEDFAERLKAFAPVRIERVEEIDANWGVDGVARRTLEGATLDVTPADWAELREESKFKKKLPDKAIVLISLVLSYLLAITAIAIVIMIVIPAVVDSVNEIIATVKYIYPQVVSFLKDNGFDTAELDAMIKNINFDTIWSAFTANAGTIFDTLVHSVNGIITILANLVTMVIFSIYLLANKRNLRRQSRKLISAYFPEKTAPKVQYVFDLVITTFSKFFSGQCLEAIILGLIFFIVLSITGFPYAPVISLIIGVTAFIPYVGAFIGCAVGVLLILMQSPMRALIFVAVFLVIQQLENNLIYPRVVGTSIGLPAMWTFAALIVGGAAYGVVGMLVFIPVASILYTLIRNDVNAKLRIKNEKKLQANSTIEGSETEEK
jgi:predicted PurR-regulated permease PerM